MCGGFGREPARRCVERASLPVALMLVMGTRWREAWVPAAKAVNNKLHCGSLFPEVREWSGR